ncbi:MAG: NADH-quinone oxidoreductase subunit A [Candidatus Omnitrophota bacterium]
MELKDYLGVLIVFILAAGFAATFLFLAEVLGPRRPNAAKNTPYETGKIPFESPSGRHNVKFYLAGMLFVLFDVELVFLFPWAVVYRELGVFGFVEMFFFLVLLLLGFAYAWRKGAFQWR